MTSANFIQKRPKFDYGKWHDHYILPWGDCHPDYTAIPIGKPTGVKVCKRRENRVAENPNIQPGTYLDRENLYDPRAKETRLFNNLSREERVIPLEVRHYVREKNLDRCRGIGF